MDPATGIGLVGSIIGIIGGVSDAAKAVRKIKDRPQAFRIVENDLPIINGILERAKSNYENDQGPLTEEILVILQACKNSAEELKRIFVKIETQCKENGEWAWPKAREWYRAALKTQNSHKVEMLMESIWKDMKKLAMAETLRLHEYMETITAALKTLQSVEASLDDSEFGQGGPQQTVYGGEGTQNYASGTNPQINHTKISGGNNTNYWGTVYNTIIIQIEQKASVQGTEVFEEDVMNAIKRWSLELRFNCTKLHELEDTQPSPGTCQWLFKNAEFQAWEGLQMPEEQTRRILVLVGKAGSGKSVLLHQAFQYCSSSGLSKMRINTKFFFNSKDKGSLERTTNGFLRSLLSQLIEHLPPSIEVYSVLQTFKNLQGDQGFDDHLLRKAIYHVISLLTNDEILIFLDALDECMGNAESRLPIPDDLLGFLNNLISGHGNVRLCVSTRSRRDFGLHEILKFTAVVDVTCNNRDDIKQYLNTQLASLSAERPSLVPKLKFIMLARASNMFIWIRLVTLKIRDLATSGLLDKDMLQVVSSFPEDLDDVYQTLLDRMDQSQCKDAVSLLQLIYVATRPLSIAEVMSALRKTNDYREPHGMDWFVDRLHNLSGGLIEVQNRRQLASSNRLALSETLATKTVQFVHQSVVDFMKKGKLEAFMGSSEEEFEQRCHAEVAKICMNTLVTAPMLNADKEPDVPEDEFLTYASQFWTLHARVADGTMSLDDDLKRTFAKCPRRYNWINKRFTASIVKGGKTYLRIDREHFPDERMLWHTHGIASEHEAASDKKIPEQNLLVLMAFEGCTQLVSMHADLCRKKNQCCGNPNTLGRALFLAAYRGWTRTTEVLCEIAERNGVAIDNNIVYGDETPLHAASRNNKPKIVKFLLERQANPFTTSFFYGNSPLQTAISLGNLEVVRVLLQPPSDDERMRQLLCVKNWSGKAAIHIAAELADIRVLQELFNVMEDFEIGDLVFEKAGLSGEGQTALELVEYSKKDVEIMLAEGPEKHNQKFLGDLKCRQEELEEAVRMLMKFMDQWEDE